MTSWVSYDKINLYRSNIIVLNTNRWMTEINSWFPLEVSWLLLITVLVTCHKGLTLQDSSARITSKFENIRAPLNILAYWTNHVGEPLALHKHLPWGQETICCHAGSWGINIFISFVSLFIDGQSIITVLLILFLYFSHFLFFLYIIAVLPVTYSKKNRHVFFH